VVQHIVDFLDDMPPLPEMFLLGMLIGPPLVLIHELGHALAALWRTDGPVFVRIGARQRRWALRAGRFSVEAGPSEIALAGGFCAYDPRNVSPRSLALIAMSGPLASLAGAVATALLWSRTHGLARDAMNAATIGGAIAAVVNALPLTIRGRHDGVEHVVRLDGLHALDALRDARAPLPAPAPRDVKAGPVAERWAAEVDAASERARAARARTNVARMRTRESERRTSSIPPPAS
jgi:hypothetical protein